MPLPDRSLEDGARVVVVVLLIADCYHNLQFDFQPAK
jgi:hypothetical protein